MKTTRTPPLPEAEVVLLWQQRVRNQRSLVSSEGETLEVVYPGRMNDSRGGDFRDALITTGTQSHRGCIEIHSRSSGWQAHGHDRDPAYNRVVLHVAMEKDHPGPTLLQNGQAIPTVVLGDNTPGNTDAASGLPCREGVRQISRGLIEERLERYGESRLEARAARYQDDLESADPDQVLYQGVLEALGYTRNQVPFRELAHRVTLKTVESVASSKKSPWHLPTFLLGQAGLLPSQRFLRSKDEDYIVQIEKIWSGWSLPGVLSYRDWELYKVRPGNYPVRRLIALSTLVRRFLARGWARYFQDLIRDVTTRLAHRELETAFLVPASDYWAQHYDFGSPGRSGSADLLGRTRAAEIVINVVLPFFLAWSRRRSDPSLEDHIREIYFHYPPLETNSIERHMLDQLSLDRTRVCSAVRQQGLLYLYKIMCTQGQCCRCSFVV